MKKGKNYWLILIFTCLAVIGCVKKYKRTVNVCSNKLYVEIFNVNTAGVDAHYLTDSLSFRLYVGRFDNEHENFHYMCERDSVVIEKLATVDTSGIRQVIESRAYKLEDLKNKRNFK